MDNKIIGYCEPKWYSCSMENSCQVTCFVFKARSEEQLVRRIKRQEVLGWYYDGCLSPVKEIDYRRAKELIGLGAHYVWR